MQSEDNGGNERQKGNAEGVKALKNLKDLIGRTADLIRNSEKTVALTGAGISTESGIPDYRSKGTGLWEKFDPIAKASATALLSDPAEFYRFNLPRWTAYRDAEPNTAHRALAKLEEAGLLFSLITQNIDGLHIKAGSMRVWEVHGHLRTCRCMKCSRSYPFTELTRQFEKGTNPPVCPKCSAVLRPDVVLFEDPMGKDYLRALEDLRGCRLLIVVGSSLAVYPVADMPSYAQKLVIVNREPTPWDSRAEVVAHCSAGEFFEGLLEALGL
ncbi:MAG: NAD-dependent deacylase [Firmicutes bacterium]|nr:NAD-dependent deacylase [Bacillota bacterium]